MAKKDTSGQINMFDYFGGDGDVQMVSLMPGDDFIDDAIGGGFNAGFEDFDPEEPEENAENAETVAHSEDEILLKRMEDASEEEATLPANPTTAKAEAQPGKEKTEEIPAKPKTSKKRQEGGAGYKLTFRDKNRPVMYRCFSLSGDKADATVAYLDYNRVYVKEPGTAAQSYQFEDSKSAVNYYMDAIQRLSGDGLMQMIEAEAVIQPTESLPME